MYTVHMHNAHVNCTHCTHTQFELPYTLSYTQTHI